MTPDLSRRIARALHALPPGAVPLEQRIEVAPVSEPFDRLEDLPAWVRGLVETGEAILRTR